MIATVEGESVGYEDVGSGLPVVFLHGFPHDRTLWTSQVGSLAVQTRTITIDLRGFGESSGSATSIGDYAGDVDGLLRTLGITSAVFVGLSMGGYVLFELWRRHPSLFRALVLADTRATPDDEAARAKRDEQISFVSTNGSPLLAGHLIQGMIGKTTREERPEVREHVHAILSRAPVRGIVGALTAMRDRIDSTPTLPTIDAPTLIMAGDEDVITPPSDARAMHAAIPGSRLEIIAGSGHLTCMERPAAFNHLLSEFLASLAYS